MSARGRTASLPPSDHVRPEPLAADGLIVLHYDDTGRVRKYDFSTLPVAESMQRSLAALFASRCTPHCWTSHRTSALSWVLVGKLAVFLSKQERPPRDLDELTAPLIRQWRVSQPRTGGGHNAIAKVASLLRGDTR